MASAERFHYSRTVDGTSPPRLAEPEIRRAPQPVRRPAARRTNRGLVMVLCLSWIVLMSFSLYLIHLNSLIHQESSAITRAREELSLLQKRNMELEARLVQAQSVQNIEKWAVSRGMRRPESVSTLKMDPNGLVRVEPSVAPARVAEAPTGFWGSLRAYVAKMADTLSLVGSPR